MQQADALIALVVGIVAGKSDVQVNLNIGDVHGLPPDWVDLIVDRVRSGINRATRST